MSVLSKFMSTKKILTRINNLRRVTMVKLRILKFDKKWYLFTITKVVKIEMFVLPSVFSHCRPFNWQWTLFVSCQRPVFSLGVSQHMHKITCEDLSSIGRRSCEIITKLCFQMLDFETSISNFISHNVLYYQPLPIRPIRNKVLC